MKRQNFKKLMALVLAIATLTLAVTPLGVTAEAPSVTLPSGLTTDGSYESHGDSKIYYYKGVSKDNYDTYISKLEDEGYEVLKTYEADSCHYSLLDNGTNTVFVSFLRSVSTTSAKGRLRVFVQKSGTPYHLESAATEANVCEPKLWQLDVDNTSDDGGMGYVIRLTDGTFIVIDGGYRNDNRDAKNLYSILKANTPGGGEPVITAWFITHLHVDHYGVLNNFTELYSDRVTVKGFYYNFASQTFGTHNSAEFADSREGFMRDWKGATLYSKIHSGMVMGFAGAEVEVLATHEDIKQSYYKNSYYTTANDFNEDSNSNGDDINNTSTVFRVNIAGQSIMFLADAQEAVSDAMLHTYTAGYLKSDIMQMAHHGFDDTVSYELINAISPKVVLWPQDIIRYKDGVITAGTTSDTKTFICYYNKTKDHTKAVKNKASEVIPAYKNEELSLPYTANTLYKSKTPDVENLAEAKVALTTVTKGNTTTQKDAIYVQKADDGSAIRLIGVLNLTEADFDKFASFGFDVTLSYNGQTYKGSFDTTTVYTSLVANGETVYATEYDGTHFYAIEISDIENKDIDLVISGTGTYVKGASEYKLTYDTVTYSIKGAPVKPDGGIKVEESGEITSFDFSDIVGGVWSQVTAMPSGEVKSFDFNAIIAGAWEQKNTQE